MGEASRDFIRRLVGCQELSESEIHIALTAAGVDELVPDGNRKLSQLGLGATGFLLDFSCALMALSRDFTSKLKFRVNGIQHRADIAKRTGIDQHLRFDSRPGGRSSGVLALATSAIIGAIYLKTKSFESVARALYALGVLDENLDKLNLMEIFKDEQGDLLPMTSLIESEPPQTSEICFGSQDVTPLPEFVTPPDLGGVSNFESFYNESGELEQSFQNGVSITDLHSQSPSTGESNLAVEGRQMLDVDSRVHPEMHVGNFHDIGILPRPAEQHAIPTEFNVALMVCEELCQPHGSPGQFANQKSSSQHSPGKRKNTSTMELQKRKYKLCMFLIEVGSSQSLIALRAALRYTREMGDQLQSVQSRRWVSRDLTNKERFKVIGEIEENTAFLQILRYNHILHFYRHSTGPVERTSDFAIMAAPHNNLTGQPRTRGNPRNIEVATAVDKTMRDIFPDLERSSDIYRRKRRAVLDCRKFGQRLHILAECFGHAVLGLIHFDRSGIIAPADEAFGNFVKILEDSQGDPLRMMSTAAKPAFEHILYEDMRQQNLFALERQIPGDILKLPKGSQELRNLLQ
ncbi:uncharacterized protein N7487_011651 [Penicillium crustosum]|uniref:uncharacterized protein n=1 Tax=Penicillium crustosum TaxID=36656 RepID=UPI00239939B2|nr:uncharacterized protein N7487_011651 [Penicillium crustosum]KAJ5394010.1 hypothetical protein N7487_011651 [Penicillium crustosum]